LVVEKPSKPAMTGPRKARSEAQKVRTRPRRSFAMRSIAVGLRSPCFRPTMPSISARRLIRAGESVMPMPGAL